MREAILLCFAVSAALSGPSLLSGTVSGAASVRVRRLVRGGGAAGAEWPDEAKIPSVVGGGWGAGGSLGVGSLAALAALEVKAFTLLVSSGFGGVGATGGVGAGATGGAGDTFFVAGAASVISRGSHGNSLVLISETEIRKLKLKLRK